MTREVGIQCAANLIIGHPSETFEKAMDTIRFTESPPVDVVTSIYNLPPYLGTELFKWMKRSATILHRPEIYPKWELDR
jgi:radical SAM superfamily enzyme